MVYRRRTLRFVRLLWITKRPGVTWVGSVSNKHNPSAKLGMGACISSRITTVIHVVSDHQINYNCFNEPFAVSPYRSLYWDMHGLIFETSIWLLAGSTRFLWRNQRSRRDWFARCNRVVTFGYLSLQKQTKAKFLNHTSDAALDTNSETLA